MKALHKFISAVQLFSLISKVTLTNPDSEMVQYPSSTVRRDDPRDEITKSARMVIFENPERTSATETQGFRISTVKDMGRYRPDTLVIWRQISPVGYVSSRYAQVRMQAPYSSYSFGNSRPDLVVPTDKESTGNANYKKSNSGNSPDNPGDYYSETPPPPPGSTDLRVVPRGGGFPDDFSPNPTNNMNVQNSESSSSNIPKVQTYGNRYDENIPYGIRNFGANENDPRDRNTQDVRPAITPRRPQPNTSGNFDSRQSTSSASGINREVYQPPTLPGSSNNQNAAGFANTPLAQKPQSSGNSPNENYPADRNPQNVRPASSSRRPQPNASGYSGDRESTNDASGNNFPQRGVRPPLSRPGYGGGGGSSSNTNAARPANTQNPSGSTPDPNRRVSPDANFFAGIINDFAFKLVKTVNLETNFVLSPLSIFIGLSMCYLGSNGATRAQMANVLGLDDKEVHGSRLHQGIHDLTSQIVTQSSDYQLLIANGMFLGKNISTNPEFEDDIRSYYDADVKNLDFGNPDLTVPVINEWVSKNTGNMIRSFFDSPPDPSTRLLVLNAIFFKGIWKMQFSARWTHDGYFFPADGSSKKTPTMTMYNETFAFYRSDAHKHSFIRLPYQGDQVSMIIALPFNFGEKPMPDMTDQNLCSVRDAMTDIRFDTIAIPKFRFEHVTLLRKGLQRMGITHLFSDEADLSKMRTERDIMVSKITHKSVIEINEEGTTASAITSVEIVPLTYRNKTEFIVNRPFAFYLVHEPSGLVIFYGKIFDISGEKVDVAPNNPREGVSQRGRHRG